MSDLEKVETDLVDLMVERDDLYIQACKLDRVAQKAEQLLEVVGGQIPTEHYALFTAYRELREAVRLAYCCDHCKSRIRPNVISTQEPAR